MKEVNGFMCRCGENQDPFCENVVEARDTLAFTKEKLEADDSNLLSCVVYSLNWDYAANITSIYNDQWSAVVAVTSDHVKDENKRLRVYMQCDRVEDGVAAVWKAFYDEFGDPEHFNPYPDDD